IAWLAVPPLATHYAQKIASEQLGRTVRIGAIDFKPWSLELSVSDIVVAAAGNAVDALPQLQIQRIYLDAELQSLLRLAPVVDAITVNAPVLRLTHLGEGRYDIDDILAKLQPAPDAPPSEPQRFALYNLALVGGALDFTDRSVNKTHTLRALELSVPFLSNLESQREVKVEPRLAFTLNGSAFDSAAAATPFAQTRKTDATFKLNGLDLAPYLAYLPAGLPVQLQAGLVDADIQLAFQQSPQLAVRLSGTAALRQVRLADARSKELLEFAALKLTLADVQPLARSAQITAIDLQSPRLLLRRDAAGRLNLLTTAVPEKSKTVANKQEATPASGQKDIKNTPQETTGWKLALGQFKLSGGTLDWVDETTRPTARLPLTALALQASAVAWPMAEPAQFSGSAMLEKSALAFSGSGTDKTATLTASISALPLALARPYLAQQLVPQASGTLNAALGLQWQAPNLVVTAPQLTLADFALAEGKTPLASLKKLELTDATVDLARQSVALGKLTLTQPKATVSRDAQQRWMFERWRTAPAATAATASTSAAPPGKPWAIALKDFALDGGAVAFTDNAQRKPVALDIAALRVAMKNIAPDSSKASPLTVSARVSSGGGAPGQLDYKGSLALAPLAADGAVQIQRLPLHALEPYFGDALNIELLRADAGFKGNLRYADAPAGPSLKLAGDATLEELRAVGAAPTGAASDKGLQQDEEILRWKSLNLRGVDVALAPGSATTVNVAETALADFFARLVVNETGRINLQDLVKSSATAAAPDASKSGAASPASTPANGQNDIKSAANPAAIINFGPISLLNGQVYFSDRFIKPNYSANLSDLVGKLGAFSSQAVPGQPPQLADLELRGRAEGTASLEILGKLNPLAQPLALDITGKVRDLELPPLSPYAIKYAGYGIERGKLSLDVNYTVLPDGQLTAGNKFVLNQLSFGEKVEGAPNSLPVKLAVALLADRNGVIDINLP
ncbi:MAG: DUF748 domain-containing protein, partial [Pseudomonadota bacterium]